jgi:hypothetical protein
MKIALTVLMLMLLLVRQGSCQEVTQEWVFAGASTMQGWSPNAAAKGARLTPEGLQVGPCEFDPFLTITGLSIPGHPAMRVEVEAGCDHDGEWQLFWAVDEEGPFGGFSEKRSARFSVRAGQVRPYVVFPGWQTGERILKLRLDAPDYSTFTVRAIRVTVQTMPDVAEAKVSGVAEWTFPADAGQWSVFPSDRRGEAEAGPEGWKLEGGSGMIAFSPALDLDADQNTWVTIAARSTRETRIALRWLSSQKGGLHSLTVPLQRTVKPRFYNVDLSGNNDWQGRITVLGLEAPEEDGTDVYLVSLKAGPERSGPAQLDVAFAGFTAPFVRQGWDATFEARLMNTGGAPSAPGEATLTPRGALSLAAGQPATQPLAALAPGETRTISWRVRASEGDNHGVELKLQTGESEQTRTVPLSCHPALPERLSRKSAYIPPPEPAPTGEYLVGAYYFPGWHTYSRWSCLDDFPERHPVLGYYREGNPEVADWHIKWALEHGISFFIYDWYWSAGDRWLEHALHDGYFNARYRDRMKFCLLWANHNPKGTSSLEDMEAVTRYWIEHYFRRPEYLKVDGKPVMVIFSPYRFREDMGVEGTRQALERSREICREAGLPGIYFVACTYPGEGNIRLLEQEGYDALSGYNYPTAGDGGRKVAPYDAMVRGYKEFWEAIDAAATIPYIPVTEPGWDSRPWHGPGARVRTGKHPDKFRAMLANAREFVDSAGRRLPAGQKIVFVEAWNEFGEGDYIEPHREFGFGYLDAIRDVFSTAPDQHYDLVPEDVGLGPYTLPKPEDASGWDFRGKRHEVFFQNLKEEASDAAGLRMISTGDDAALYLPGTRLDAGRFRCIEIRMSVTAGRQAQLFWTSGDGFKEVWSQRFDIVPDGTMRTYHLDLSGKPRWRGTIRQLRLDPCEVRDAKVTLESVRLLESCP